ncbi:hypothetical protein PV10_06396 [Exophiala mesophila]|uniref:Thioesterase domain-containing protein n=1 Tax=Exophiala mesophila TaxID=212818 RepID=A0A0D1XUM2_EXOME|nr:uncharacterized protein PV10_06396 [Exophiala mesophila]KIV91906.1 hypothetical protein PV10_06396 [Exophiala mesophila]
MQENQGSLRAEEKTRAMADVEANVAFFQMVPWTRQVLATGIFEAIPTSYRTSRQAGEDTFFHETLNTSSTFPHWLWLARKQAATVELDRSHRYSTGCTSPSLSQLNSMFLVEVGEALWGFKHTMHGGAICALLDQALSLCAGRYQKASEHTNGTVYTATLSVNFRQPVIVPAVLMVECWLEQHTGRKWHIHARLVDGQHRTLCEAQGVWILSSSVL